MQRPSRGSTPALNPVPWRNPYKEARRAIYALCPQRVRNWREERYCAKYGEVELHLVEFLCRADEDAIDVGANVGIYVHSLRRHARRVIAYEPIPAMAEELRRKFRGDVDVNTVALSDGTGVVKLRIPLIEDQEVLGCSTIAPEAAADYPVCRTIEVQTDRLDNVYRGQLGFMKIDVEGHELAVLHGARETIRRCLPRLLVEVEERLSPGGVLRTASFFDELGYRGYYVHGRQLEPIERFSAATLQQPANQPDLTVPLSESHRSASYVNNFIFLPPDEPVETRDNMAARLARL
jgi:FkbM family methyltransferase